MDDRWNPTWIYWKGALKPIKQACQWIKQSWSWVRDDFILKSFKKCGISNSLDGSKDHLIYKEDNDDEEEEEESLNDNFKDLKVSSVL